MEPSKPRYPQEAIDSFFLTAAELQGDARNAYLTEVCRGDETLRAQLELMLRHAPDAEEFIARIVTDSAADVIATEAVQKQFGAYRIVSELGRGGMGSVYLAERDDEEFSKKVAIKLIAPGLGSAAVLRRFRQERQILARLDHPYIARLLDAGTSADGSPYFVMEYIEGEPIDRWCREHRLSIEARCRLFLQVCEAVAFAHRNLVVHRDLKPSNILIDSEGTPKLLDFGIAKVLDESSAVPSAGTVTLLQAWTPDYASPEQVRGEPVTTATDVCSLGAVVYELLTGEKARRLTTYVRSEIERVICEANTIPPSEAVLTLDPATAEEFQHRSLKAVSHHLRGDLDNIVLMAMRKEPDRRYASVDKLADDIGRFLAGRPVRARKDTLGYRGAKFIRRNRLAVLGAAIAALCLTAGSITTLVQKHWADVHRAAAEVQRRRAEERSLEAEKQRRFAESEHLEANRERDFAQSQAVEAERARRRADDQMVQIAGLANKVLLDINDQLANLTGATKVRQEMVETTLQYLNHLHQQAGEDLRVLQVLATAYERLGDVTGRPLHPSLGNTKDALQDYQISLRIAEQLLARNPRDPDLSVLQLGLYDRLGDVDTVMGKLSAAQEMYTHGVTLADRLYDLHPSGKSGANVVQLLNNRARSLTSTNTPLAMRYIDQAIALAEELNRKDPSDESGDWLSSAISTKGDIYSIMGDAASQIACYRKMLAMREQVAAHNPNNPNLQRDLMLGFGKLAGALSSEFNPNSAADTPAAIQYYRRAIAVAESLQQRDPADQLAKLDLANALFRMGCVEREPAVIEEGAANTVRAIALLKEVLQTSSENTQHRAYLGYAQECSGLLAEEKGEWQQAATEFQESARTVEAGALNKADISSRVQWLEDMIDLARVYGRLGQRDQALAVVAQYTDTLHRWSGEPPPNLHMQIRSALALAVPGEVYELLAHAPGASSQIRQSDLEAAIAADQQALADLQKLPATPFLQRWQKRISEIHQRLARCRSQLHEDASAAPVKDPSPQAK
jgi:serine/threonine protein kinase/tetratricopeptide (TPR) repeat protein